MSTPATNLDPIIRTGDRIHAQTVSVLKVSPAASWDWKTCDSAMTLGALANHFYLAEVGLIDALETGQFSSRPRPEPKSNAEDLVAAFDEAHQRLNAVIAGLTEEQLREEITPFGEKYGNMSRKTLVHSMHEHEIHHRGQIYVYLRMLGAPVPPLFG